MPGVAKDHPKWSKWSDAFDELASAAAELRVCEGLTPTDPAYKAALARRRAALVVYNKISAELE
jgi:hypothetical protein